MGPHPDLPGPDTVCARAASTVNALVMKALPLCDPVRKVSIISRGMALGWTMALPEEDKYLVSKQELKQLIDEEVRSMIKEAYETAKRILTEQRAKMEVVVQRLRIEETIDAGQLEEIVGARLGAATQGVP